jgi:DNA-binding NarL/FixJ family response regulator
VEETAVLRILIIEDHPLFRRALDTALRSSGMEVDLHQSGNLFDAIRTLTGKTRFDLVLLDLRLPNVEGFDGLLTLRKRFPKLPIAIVSSLYDENIIRVAFSFGVSGFIPKSTLREDLIGAIKKIVDGEIYVPPPLSDPVTPAAESATATAAKLMTLTKRQLKILELIRLGMSNREIGETLGISETTVKVHVSEVLHKLGVLTRTQATILAKQCDFDALIQQRTGI